MYSYYYIYEKWPEVDTFTCVSVSSPETFLERNTSYSEVSLNSKLFVDKKGSSHLKGTLINDGNLEFIIRSSSLNSYQT